MDTHEIPDDALTVGVDVGGTKIAAGVVDGTGKLLAHTRRETPAQNTAGVLSGIADAVRELAATHEVAAVGIGDRPGVGVGFFATSLSPDSAAIASSSG